MGSNKRNISLQENNLIFKIIEKMLLIVISTIIVLFLISQMKRYTIKDYDKFAKENNIEYNIITCPKCGVEIPDTIQFCYNCNVPLFKTDEKFNEILGRIENSVEPTKTEIIISVGEKITEVIIVYIFLNILIKM